MCAIMSQPGGPDINFNQDRCKKDHYAFKIFTRNVKEDSMANFACDLMTIYQEEYPDFAILMEYFMVIPLNSASCERGFSCQNLTKVKSRNRLTEARMNQLLQVTINGDPFGKFDYGEAAKKFNEMKERRK